MTLEILPYIRLIRPHHWVKNAFVFAPLFFTPTLLSMTSLTTVALAALTFSFMSSSIYIFNDYVDRENDKNHPRKKKRPLPSGAITPQTALFLHGIFLTLGIYGASTLGVKFLSLVVLYFVLNLLYSLKLKSLPIIDVMCIAAGFILRILGGAAVIDIQASKWILICTGLLSLFLAFAKRRDDLVQQLDAKHRKSLSGYNKAFLDVVIPVILTTLLMAYLMFTIDDSAPLRQYSEHLYLTVPFVVFGILRYLQLIYVEENSGSPTRILLSDKPIVLTVIGWIVTFGSLIYL